MATVRLFVNDLSRSRAFYEHALGFELIEAWGPAFAIVQRGDLQIWLSGPATSAAKRWSDGTVPTPGGFNRIVLPIEDWEAQADAIAIHGGRIANGPLEGPGGTQIVVCDPDGNSIEFFEG
ncbi:MAG: VOC family protein [Methanoregulaceae archaeon]|jgi:catechol 2,3-dioxygenase-like lactoylglutathione lyase family enzyme|nr:VOC family protein [Methanoregulaceae archaeon]